MKRLDKINKSIVRCSKCSRLAQCRVAVSNSSQPKKWRGTEYWSKPVPGFGDENAQILIVGLAPGLHGANRTGRPFTGDGAGILLYQSLYENGFASKPEVFSRHDGQTLTNVYISNIVKCVPPDNKPVADEINSCLPFLKAELSALPSVKYIMALGVLAHNAVLKIFNQDWVTIRKKDFPFKHGAIYQIHPNIPQLVNCYHPSIYNVNTGRITLDMMSLVLQSLKI